MSYVYLYNALYESVLDFLNFLKLDLFYEIDIIRKFGQN